MYRMLYFDAGDIMYGGPISEGSWSPGEYCLLGNTNSLRFCLALVVTSPYWWPLLIGWIGWHRLIWKDIIKLSSLFFDPILISLQLQIPLGVVLAIPPFNYLVNLVVSKIAPAVIAGNALVLKPPTQVWI